MGQAMFMLAATGVANTGMLIVVCLTSCYSFKLSFLADASAFSLVHQGVGALRSAAPVGLRLTLRLWLRGWSTTPSFLGLFSLPAAPPARLGSAFGSGLSVGSVIWLILRQPRPSSA